MAELDINKLVHDYERDGFVSPVRLISEEQAAEHRAVMEDAEVSIGNLHYKPGVHTILRSAFEMATLPHLLDLIERMIGPNILLYNVTYIIKEPGSKSFVSWHQDLTYWGLSHDDQVSMWLALSGADETAGCMRMIPGSHKTGMMNHDRMDSDDNVLRNNQAVRDVDEADAVHCPLRPGEASFHHGWTLHASTPNAGEDRRIGLNVQYLATHVHQRRQHSDTALLVRGEDRYQHFEPVIPASVDLDPVAIHRWKEIERIHVSNTRA